MKLLVIDNNLHLRGYPQGAMVRAYLPKRYMLASKVVRADKINESHYSYDKFILTGSTAYVRQKTGWMNKEWKLIEYCVERKIPVLGICFGSQMLSSYLFGEESVEAMPVPISGSMLFKQIKNNPLFNGLPKNFGVVSTHYEVTKVPSKYSIGMCEEMETYAFFYPPNIYGIQFHPELMGRLGRGLVRLQKILYDRLVYQDFTEKSKASFGKQIYRNFLEL